MARCEWADKCSFFKVTVGYSPELNSTMKERFCLTDNRDCARMGAMDCIPIDEIPEDLLPTDHESLSAMCADRGCTIRRR